MDDLSLLNPTERKVYACIPVGSAHPISKEKLARLVKVFNAKQRITRKFRNARNYKKIITVLNHGIRTCNETLSLLNESNRLTQIINKLKHQKRNEDQ